jgi:hypothetical protein
MAAPPELGDVVNDPKICRRLAATTIAALIALGLAVLEDPAQAQARPGPFPRWCPGDFWDSGWGDNWDPIECHADGPAAAQGSYTSDPDELPAQSSDPADTGELPSQSSGLGDTGELPTQGGDPGGPGGVPPQGGYPGGVQGSGPGGIGEPPPL